jgi:C4-type Zn-finger protein
VEIPELEFELGMAVLGGKFTTLEGLLKDIRELVSAECAASLLLAVWQWEGVTLFVRV